MSKKSLEAVEELRKIMRIVYSERERMQVKKERDEARPKSGMGLDGYSLMAPKRVKR